MIDRLQGDGRPAAPNMLRKVVIAILLFLPLAACDRRPVKPEEVKAGDIVEPTWRESGGGSDDPEPTNVTFYEYSDKQAFRTTGQSISFKIPKYFTTSSAAREGGPIINMILQFDLNTDGPYLPAAYGSQEEFARHEPDTMVVTMRSYAPYRAFSPAELFLGVVPVDGLSGVHKLNQSGQYCGWDTLFPATGNSNGNRFQIPDQAPRSANWPYSGAVVFAKRGDDGRYSSILSCSDNVRTDGYPFCGTWDDFRGWPIELLYSGRFVCSSSNIAEHAKKFLSKYVSGETSRANGEKENRHSTDSGE